MKNEILSNAFTFLKWLLISLALTACASKVVIPTQPYVSPPKSSLITIYVFRTNSMPLKANLNVAVDGHSVALLPDNRFTWFQIPKGKHVISAGYPSLPDMTARLEQEFSEGHAYLFQYDSGDRGMSLFGQYAEPVPVGMMANGRWWTRLQVLPESKIERVVVDLPYVVANP